MGVLPWRWCRMASVGQVWTQCPEAAALRRPELGHAAPSECKRGRERSRSSVPVQKGKETEKKESDELPQV